MELKKIFKQRKIDNGQIGGVIQMIMQSSFILSFFTFVNTSGVFYHVYLHKFVSVWTYIILFLCIWGGWVLFYYTIQYPSHIRFSNRQSYTHGSPVKRDFQKVLTKLDEIEAKISQEQDK
jgi:hypothetical protein